MGKFGQRLFVLSIVVSLAIFFGIELATNGIADKGGIGTTENLVIKDKLTAKDLMPDVEAVPQSQPEETAIGVSVPPVGSSPSQALALNRSETALESLVTFTGNAVHSTAQAGVKLFVALVDGLLN